jgi:hypothetical protein
MNENVAGVSCFRTQIFISFHSSYNIFNPPTSTPRIKSLNENTYIQNMFDVILTQ